MMLIGSLSRGKIGEKLHVEPDSITPGKSMNNPVEYTIIAVPFHADAATHEELAREVNEKLSDGYELYGPPFLSEEMMYQAMTKELPMALR